MNLEAILSNLSAEYKAKPDLDLKNLLGIVESYDSNDYTNYIEYSDKKYNRVVLFRNAEFEVLLLCWRANQASGFHKHSSNGCIMRMLEGSLSEERRHPNDELEVFHHKTKETIYMSNELGTHRVFNDSAANAVSLHIYSPSGFI